MSNTKRFFIQCARVILALLAVVWAILLLNIVLEYARLGGEARVNWVGVVIDVAIEAISAYGYIKLTKIVNTKAAPASSVPNAKAPKLRNGTFALNTSHKRFWFVVLVCGIVICILTYVCFLLFTQYGFLTFSSVLFSYPQNKIHPWYKWFMFIGVASICIGLFLSFLYDLAVGKVASWVRGNGRTHP